jgi:hypothetical protein
MLGCVAMDAASLCRTAQWGVSLEFLSLVFPWSVGLSGAGKISEVVSSEGWFVSSHWSLVPTGQVAIKLCGSSLPDSPRWSDMCLFTPGGN